MDEPRLRMYEDREPPPGARFVECPIETNGEETDPCMGCPGWGRECGALWKPPSDAVE